MARNSWACTKTVCPYMVCGNSPVPWPARWYCKNCLGKSLLATVTSVPSGTWPSMGRTRFMPWSSSYLVESPPSR
eukprot:10049439-Alexandrium_andersonii.AAC.1